MISGERILSNSNKTNFEYFRHLFAYYFVSNFVAAKDVLDIGCSDGYGSNLLAERANKVTGADFSKRVISMAKEQYIRNNLIFLVQNAEHTDFKENTFDIICAFQIIEHFSEPEFFLKEMKRILKTDGLLIISTLNRETSGSIYNPYHYYEYNKEEFINVLNKNLSIYKFYGVNASKRIKELMKSFKSNAKTISKLDFLNLRNLKESILIRKFYDIAVSISILNLYKKNSEILRQININDFFISENDFYKVIDFIAICKK